MLRKVSRSTRFDPHWLLPLPLTFAFPYLGTWMWRIASMLVAVIPLCIHKPRSDTSVGDDVSCLMCLRKRWFVLKFREATQTGGIQSDRNVSQENVGRPMMCLIMLPGIVRRERREQREQGADAAAGRGIHATQAAAGQRKQEVGGARWRRGRDHRGREASTRGDAGAMECGEESRRKYLPAQSAKEPVQGVLRGEYLPAQSAKEPL